MFKYLVVFLGGAFVGGGLAYLYLQKKYTITYAEESEKEKTEEVVEEVKEVEVAEEPSKEEVNDIFRETYYEKIKKHTTRENGEDDWNERYEDALRKDDPVALAKCIAESAAMVPYSELPEYVKGKLDSSVQEFVNNKNEDAEIDVEIVPEDDEEEPYNLLYLYSPTDYIHTVSEDDAYTRDGYDSYEDEYLVFYADDVLTTDCDKPFDVEDVGGEDFLKFMRNKYDPLQPEIYVRNDHTHTFYTIVYDSIPFYDEEEEDNEEE